MFHDRNALTQTPLRPSANTSNIDAMNPVEIRRSNTETLPNEMKFLNDYLESEYANEDEHQTSEYFVSVSLDEMVCALFAILSIGSGIIYYEVRTCKEECDEFSAQREKAEKCALAFVSVGVLLFLLTLISKYYHYYKLYIIAKYTSINNSFWKTGLWVPLIIEVIFALVHPSLLLKNKKVTTGKGWNIKKVVYNINDFLLVIMIFRLYYLVKLAIISTKYYSARADRVCKMMGMRLNFFFTVKCVMIKNTSLFLIFTTFTFCFGLAYMMKIIEGPAYYLSEDRTNYNKFTDYGNCFWTIFVTMTSVGYGDFVPQTMLGRLISFLTALSGNILLAMNISFLQSKTQISADEENALNFIERMEERETMQSIAASYFKSNFTYFIAKKKFIRNEDERTQANKKTLFELAKQKYLKRKEFKKKLHQFQVKYKMPTDLDKVKRKINTMSNAIVTSNKKINIIFEKIQDLVQNLEKYGEQTISENFQ